MAPAPPPQVVIRPLRIDEHRGVYDIDMTEDGDIVYTVEHGHLRATVEEWHRPPRTREAWERHLTAWHTILENGGAAWGAFVDRMVGIAVLRYRLEVETAQLVALFVSRPYRRQGVATSLMREVVGAACASGAAALYVSATPSRSAVGFYRSQGFELAERVHPELFELEPEDIHMARTL